MPGIYVRSLLQGCPEVRKIGGASMNFAKFFEKFKKYSNHFYGFVTSFERFPRLFFKNASSLSTIFEKCSTFSEFLLDF